MADKKKNLAEKVVYFLTENGISRKKAQEISKGLVATVRRAVSAELKAKTEPKPEKPGKKILRTDLEVVDNHGTKGAEVFQRMQGISSGTTYVVAAVKGENGIISVRDLTSYYNVKFYPDLTFWDVSKEHLTELGGYSFLTRREYGYERIHLPKEGLDMLLKEVAAKAKSKSRIKNLADRLKAALFQPVRTALNQLYGYAVQ